MRTPSPSAVPRAPGRVRVVLALAACGLLSVSAAPAEGGEVSFTREIAPLLVRRCLACHGEQKFQGKYQLHSFGALLKPGETGEPILRPGDPAGSHLLTLLTSDDPDFRMPKDSAPLRPEELERVRRWIAAGAEFDGADPAAPLVGLARWIHPPPPEVYPRPFPVTAAAFHPSGEELAVGGHHEVLIYRAEDGRLLRRLPGLAERTYALAFTRDGGRLAAACGSPGRMGEVKLLNPADGALLQHFGSQADCALALAFSPDESRLAVCGADHAVRIFETSTGREQLTLRAHSDWVLAVAWSPEGDRLVTAARDKTCKVFNAGDGALVTTFTDHGDWVYGVTYHTDGRHAISCGADQRIRYWLADDPGWENPEKMDKKKRHQVGEIGGFGGPVHRLLAADGRLFACSADRSLRAFELEKRNHLRTFSGHGDWLHALDYHPGSKRLVSGSADGQVRLWNSEGKNEQEWGLTTFLVAPGKSEAASSAGE